MKHVGIVVDDLAMAFLVELGLKLQGQRLVEGCWEDRIGEERLLGGERRRTILSAHSHQQFERPGPNGTTLVNPGSVGSPLDGDTRAAWALYEMGRIAFRQTEYDVERAAAKMPTLGEWAEPIVQRTERASD
jgi:diadenosine tetraphosphatase ApaH/serine/threonine PP2A family protein phosphatase